MNIKKLIGLAVLLIGIVLIIFAVCAKYKIANAKGAVETMTSPFSGNAVGKMVGSEAMGAASQYDAKVQMVLIGGIVLAVIGGCVVIFCRKRKR